MNSTNKNISFQGKKLTVTGRELKVGDKLPKIRLTGVDMADYGSEQLKGKTVIVSVVPSLDTPTCSIQTKRFNQEAAAMGDSVVILTVSMDLPFAQKRWCGAEGVSKVVTASDYKYRAFGEDFGVHIQEWGLLARAIIVADKSGTIRHVEYVPSISDEPDYSSAIKAAKMG